MNRTAWPLFAICALCVIGISVLSATGNPIPDVLPAIALASLTGAAGVTIPTTNPATAAAPRSLFGRKAKAASPPPPAPQPGPLPVTSPPVP